ncbi:hypothetical protein EZS27_024625 [termite gut metagenome]|uniref:Tyrosine recombinase XerD n=1 Tax=termite gut metagenome TaxID=433724 RepID=A0A5J4QY62_9ZZZZ
MQTDLKLLFYLKRTEVKQDGTCPLMGRITIGKTVAQFSADFLVFQRIALSKTGNG